MTASDNTKFDLIEYSISPITMSSREIAELTGKRHDNVMADIRNMLETLGEGTALKFQGSYVGANNKPLPCFDLPKRETLILVSGYSVELRARIIDRWMELEEAQGPLTPAETLLKQVQLMVAVERRQKEIQAKQVQQDAAIAENTTRLNQIETAGDHFTVIGYARWVKQGYSIDLKTAADVGRRATRRANALGVRITKIPDPRFGAVSQYPKAILDDAWNECFPAPEGVH